MKERMIEIIKNGGIVSVTLDKGIWCSVDSFSPIMDDSFFGYDKDGDEEEYYFSEVIEVEQV